MYGFTWFDVNDKVGSVVKMVGAFAAAAAYDCGWPVRDPTGRVTHVWDYGRS
jgi:hypothetical protein